MTSSVSPRRLGVVVFALALCVAPRVARAAEMPLATVVAAQIADKWSVDAADVQLDFGRAAAQVAALPASASCRLAGKGTDGYFVCLFHGDGADDVAVRVRAGVREATPVAAHALSAGAILAEGDVTTTVGSHWGPPRTLTHGTAPAAGWIVRRALAAGDALRDTDAAPPALVQQGQTVRVMWDRGAVHLEWNGVALNAARRGERVRARVDGRAIALDGIAADEGVVQLAGRQP